MTDAPERIWAHEPTTFDGMDVWQITPARYTTEYIRADLARPVTVAEAAKVLLNSTPNPTFDILKYPMMGEFKQSIAMQGEDGEELWQDVIIEWTTIKEIISAALRALSHVNGADHPHRKDTTMADIEDIWDDEEDMRMHGGAGDVSGPKLCRDIFDSNADGFIAELSTKIAKMKNVRASTQIGGDYNHTLTRYIGMLESAKIAAKAHRDITVKYHA